MGLLVSLILCRDGLFIAGMWPCVVNLKLGNAFLVPSEWCMTELEPETSAERSIGEKSGLVCWRTNRLKKYTDSGMICGGPSIKR